MTTGRINQVTIVRRGWPSVSRGARRDISTGQRSESAPATGAPACAANPRSGHPFYPSKFPRPAFATHHPARGGEARPSQEEIPSRSFSRCFSGSRRLQQLCTAVARGH
ncbi:hypothetical protein BVRB_038060 [Beta vulgaris subsp. vulgaris]|uniref:Uncharacterized protein n=1 Tax=Beta vulgaris subsp. vulgaris TaxID=3555 RepID=A0A0J7YQ00_BETVV|nr:hypothetical protein BVRB_038060 [Beta vulgaris subsp. vulgaris]